VQSFLVVNVAVGCVCSDHGVRNAPNISECPYHRVKSLLIRRQIFSADGALFQFPKKVYQVEMSERLGRLLSLREWWLLSLSQACTTGALVTRWGEVVRWRWSMGAFRWRNSAAGPESRLSVAQVWSQSRSTVLSPCNDSDRSGRVRDRMKTRSGVVAVGDWKVSVSV
jgi:hypothetical protein